MEESAPHVGRIERLAGILQIFAFVPIVLGGIFFLFFLPSAPSIAIIQATSEVVRYDVTVPEMAQLRLDGFTLFFENSSALSSTLGFRDANVAASSSRRPLCPKGLLIPEVGTRITYKRFGDAPLSIVLERQDNKPVASFQYLVGDIPAPARTASWIRLQGPETSDDDSDKKPACEGKVARQFPVYGVAELGSEMRPAARGEEPSGGVLTEGTLEIFARTIELGDLRDNAARIYPTGTSIDLPAGARVFEYTKNETDRSAWSGFVKPTDEGLDVRLTTPASRIAILRPGIGMTPEVISLGLFTQLFNDPTLSIVQVAIGTLFGGFQIMSGAAFWFGGRRRKSVRKVRHRLK